nr:unnamed protein product [Callosobruchus analis]
MPLSTSKDIIFCFNCMTHFKQEANQQAGMQSRNISFPLPLGKSTNNRILPGLKEQLYVKCVSKN